ncbi:hypothetical protein [Candidatus Cyanaurora vandensis]|uniref:hypothetical protein n=1 Tax=Candidatus Cyanaurora vandensis TaxID=2714958 RepID=UPI00257CE770|nr:hypothetical protein [Candidatus Cyanaurora vandensis]
MNPAHTYLEQTAQRLGLPLILPPVPAFTPVALTLPWPDSRVDVLYLPIIWTARGPLYGEAIARCGDFYIQPWDLSDSERQGYYQLARATLGDQTPAGVYLLTFEPKQGQTVAVGFTAMPTDAALVSVVVQQPDLFLCHCYAAAGLPVVEVQAWRQGAVCLTQVPAKQALVWPGVIWYPDWIGCWVYPPPTDHAGHPLAALPPLH